VLINDKIYIFGG
jgi:hypothetical protein